MPERFVKSDGSNLLNGDSWANAWQNLWYAFDGANPNTLVAGDRVTVGGVSSGYGTGMWNETQKCSVQVNGTKDDYIMIKALGGAVKINGATIGGGGPIIKFENGFGRFTRLTVDDADTDLWELYGCAADPAIYIYAVHGANPCGTLIHRVKAYNNRHGIMWHRQRGMIVADCEVFNCTSYGIYGTNEGENSQIALIGNKAYNNGTTNIRMLSTYGLFVGNLVYGASGLGDGIYITYGKYDRFAFNTMCDNYRHGINFASQWTSDVGGMVFLNNILAGKGGGGAGMGFYRHPAGVTGYCGFSNNNCWYDNIDGHYTADWAPGSNELIDIDPMLAGDYSLLEGSPCIGTGHTAWGNFDIGAIQKALEASGGFNPIGPTGLKSKYSG